MVRKIIILFFFIFLSSSCDYKPIYSTTSNNNFYIEEINFDGDIEINNLINKKLKNYQKQEAPRKFNINVYSDLKKISQSKDQKGKTTDYKIIIKTKFEINYNQKITVIQTQEDFLIKNLTNEFEEKKYEKTKIKNAIDIIINTLVIQLSQIK